MPIVGAKKEKQFLSVNSTKIDEFIFEGTANKIIKNIFYTKYKLC